MPSKEEDLRRQLEELKAQVVALSAARKAQEDCVEARAGEDEATPEATGAAAVLDAAGEALGVDFEELVDNLKHEIEELPAMTALSIFVLGLLVGRLLAR